MDTTSHAVVVGGSITGLAAAATLSPRFRVVTLIERRKPSDRGSLAPQGALPHVMLAAGNRSLERLLPGFAARLLERGALDGCADPTTLPVYWSAAGGIRDHLCLPDLGVPRALCSRGLIETQLRTATLALPNVTLVDASVDGLEVTMDRRAGATVTGVRLRGRDDPLLADLVVDAGGRAGRIEDWLVAVGLPSPPATEVVVDLRYAGFVVERRPEDFGGAALAVVQNTPTLPRVGAALPMEGERWQVVLGGYFGDAVPTDPSAARAFARSLADPVLGELFDRPYLSEPARYTFRSSRRRHWDKLREHPRGLCSVGDAVASFNPIYGQGMASALLQVEALGKCVDRHGTGPRLARAVARDTAKVVDSPWLTSTGADFMYGATAGRRPPGTELVNGYVERVMRAAAVDETVNAAFTGVQQLLAPPATLFRPAVVARALRHGSTSRYRGRVASSRADLKSPHAA